MKFIANGLGPWWFPTGLRRALTQIGRQFFREASWDRHDKGYARGTPARAECDRKFLMAMLRDASHQPSVARAALCVMAAFLLWTCVPIGGWASFQRAASAPREAP